MSRITITNKKLPGAKVEAVLYTEEQWNRLKEYVGQAERRAKEVAAELQAKKEKKICSDKMAEKWENTFVNLRKKRFESRRLRLEREKSRKYDRFLNLQTEQKKIKETVRKEARDRLYEQRDNARCALSAYKFAETLRERELQIEFARKARELEEERENEWARKIIEDVKLYKKEVADMKAKELEKKRELGKQFIEMLRNGEEQRRKEKEARQAEEREDMAFIKKEIREIEENERKEMDRRKRLVREELIENRQEVDEQKKVRKAEEKEETDAMTIIENAKIKMGNIRKEKEAQMKAAAIERREKISSTVMAAAESKGDKEEEIYQKAKAHNEKLALKRIEKEKKHVLQLRQERIDYHKEFLKQEELRNQKKHELMKWEMLQRFKADNITKMFKNLNAEKKRIKPLEVRDDNFRLADEEKLRRQEEIDYDVRALKKAIEEWQMDDQEYFNFITELKQESTEVGRPVFPLDNELCAYKKRTGLLEIPPQLKILKTNLPPDDDFQQKSAPKHKDPIRIIYTKMGNTANPLTFEVKRTPITFVTQVHKANGLQDQQKPKKP